MVGDVGPRSPRGTATAPGAALPRSPMGSSASLRSERRAWLRPGPEHWRLRQELEHGKGSKPVTETATCVDRRSTARRPRKRCAREKRNKTKKDVTPKRTGLNVQLPFGRPISPTGEGEAIATGREPSPSPRQNQKPRNRKPREGTKVPD